MFSFTNRIVLFFSLMLIFLLALYGVGSIQQFLDGTFILIARIGACCAVALAVLLLFALFQLIIVLVSTHNYRNLWCILLYALALLIAVFSCAFFSVILAL